MASRTAKGVVPGAGEIPPPLELACLTILWKRGAADVGEVREALHESRPLAYTTVMTVLERLARKGMVTRRKSGRSFRYAPARDREAMRALAIAQLVEQFFDGSVDDLNRFIRKSATGASAALPLETLPAKASSSAGAAREGTFSPAAQSGSTHSGSTLDETLL
jgi:predicted transcriptional regulator